MLSLTQLSHIHTRARPCARAHTQKKETALHLASVSGQAEVVTLLVEKGANTNAANKVACTRARVLVVEACMCVDKWSS